MSPRPERTTSSDDATRVSIDRLRLHVSGLNEGAARVFARLVAEGLAAGLRPAPGIASHDSLRIEVAAGAGESRQPVVMARRVADEIGRALSLDRATTGTDGEFPR